MKMKPRGKIRYSIALGLFCLAAVALLWSLALAETGPAATPAVGKLTPPARPLRALQVISFDCNTWAEVGRRLDEIREAGVQAIILRVFHNEGDGYYKFIKPEASRGVYFQTGQCPMVADVLGPVCEMAHRRGIAVIAWMTTRYADYGHEGESSLRCMAWDFESGAAKERKGYCPLLPEIHERLAALFTDLARYPIDGVMLQDDLMLKHTEGMNPAARKLYEKHTGRPADPSRFYRDVRVEGGRMVVGEYTDEFRAWCRWKNAGMLALAERLRSAVHSRRPNKPFGLNIYYETMTSPDKALAWYSQDLDATIASDLDFYALMLYHRQMSDELRLSRKQVLGLIDEALLDLAGRVDFTQRIWVKVQCVDWDTGTRIPHDEMAELFGRARRHGPVGLVVVPTPRSLDLVALKESFR